MWFKAAGFADLLMKPEVEGLLSAPFYSGTVWGSGFRFGGLGVHGKYGSLIAVCHCCRCG